METYYRHMGFIDPLVMMKMAEAMRSHSAADVLSTIRVPTLILAGTLDMFTPPALAEAMHENVPGIELVILEGASHGAVIEKPDEVERRRPRLPDSERRPRAQRAEESPGQEALGEEAAARSPRRSVRSRSRTRTPPRKPAKTPESSPASSRNRRI